MENLGLGPGESRQMPLSNQDVGVVQPSPTHRIDVSFSKVSLLRYKEEIVTPEGDNLWLGVAPTQLCYAVCVQAATGDHMSCR